MTEKEINQFLEATERLPRVTDLLVKMVRDFKLDHVEERPKKAETRRDLLHSVFDTVLDTIAEIAYLENIKGGSQTEPIV